MGIFDIDLIKTQIKVQDKDELFDLMVEDLFQNKYLKVKMNFLKAIKEREMILSTGIGHGIGIPHSRHSDVKELKSVVYTLAKDIDYEAIDSNPVNIVIMMAIPIDCHHDYMVLLHKISSALRDDNIRLFFQKCQESQELFDFLEKVQ